MLMKRLVLAALLPALLFSCGKKDAGNMETAELARMFGEPPMEYRPYVWWHWMGSNFSKEGIRKDLVAMKEAGIAGATVFNLTSAVQESEAPVGNLPWPDRTFRSPAYWEALAYAAEVADSLGLKIGLHNTPGYSTTGGPWITEDQGMQQVVMSRTGMEGGRTVRMPLPVPDLPSFSFYSDFVAKASKFHDIAVMAVPVKDAPAADEVLDLTGKMDASGVLEWDAPEGTWQVYRIGHACTMAFPHPVPEELLGKVFEADKMNAEVTAWHWDQVLGPLREHVGKYFGKSFNHILIDSYEAGGQNWTEGFRACFQQMHGYDPMPLFALQAADPQGAAARSFAEDLRATVSRMFLDNGFRTAREKIHAEGLEMYWEPYEGPFDTAEGVSLADLPMGEFWTGGSGKISAAVVDNAAKYGKRIVGAEAFTGWPTNSRYVEDPAFLKPSADGAFVSGANRLFLHHWVHQPFDDRYQPGMGMGWWGTHFGRNQTWFEPGKAFFTYLSRCQMLLQQGVPADRADTWIHRKTADADIYFVINPGNRPVTRTLAPWDEEALPELWDPYTGTISRAPDFGRRDSVRVALDAGASVFVVLNHGKDGYGKAPWRSGRALYARPVETDWSVEFCPKVGEPFRRDSFPLGDFSQSEDLQVKYFSGTATYTGTVTLAAGERSGSRIALDLGRLDDLAEVSVNGKPVAVLWYPPYVVDITDALVTGENVLSIAVTNNWANRMIGDEQYEPDFTWGADRGADMGRAVAAFPDWFVKGEERPSKDRKTFAVWTYFRKDSPLQPAGLAGPVRLRWLDDGACETAWGDTGDGRYRNPVLAADYSDPDVIRVGEKYYMVASDFHFMGMQVLVSDDLVNWSLAGQIYDRFDLPGWEEMAHYAGGSWAPSIRWHDGRFWVYFCTPDEGLFMSTAEDPAGPWTPLHCVQAVVGWEDPCPFWDEDGTAYLGHSLRGAGPIIIHRMSADGKTLLDEGVTVYEGPTAEGTKIHKWDGRYYLSIPEGGVRGGWQTVLRSKDLYGPYERKIVLETGSTPVNGPHQGAIVDTPDGTWWFLHFQQRDPLGRILHLQPMRWVDGWPVIGEDYDGNGVGEPVPSWDKPAGGEDRKGFLPASSDDFSSETLGLQWQFNHNPVDSAWSLARHPGSLTLDALQAPSFVKARNTLSQKLMGFAGTYTVKLDASEMADGQFAGLACMGRVNYQAGILVEGGVRSLCLASDAGESARIDLPERDVWLRLSFDIPDNAFRFWYSTDGRRFTPWGEVFPAQFGFWKGARPALFSFNRIASAGTARFDDFVYERLK